MRIEGTSSYMSRVDCLPQESGSLIVCCGASLDERAALHRGLLKLVLLPASLSLSEPWNGAQPPQKPTSLRSHLWQARRYRRRWRDGGERNLPAWCAAGLALPCPTRGARYLRSHFCLITIQRLTW